MSGKSLIKQEKFNKLFLKLKEIGKHCSYPSKTELKELIAEIGVEVIPEMKPLEEWEYTRSD